MGAKKKPSNVHADKKDQEDEMPIEAKNDILKTKIQAFKMRIVLEQEKADRARVGQAECRQHLRELDQGFEEEKKRTLEVTTDMMQQYRTMVRERDEKITGLENELYGNERDLSEKDKQLKEMIKTKDREIQEKEEVIAELRNKINDMSQEFANMLKSTLDKMQERIELANTQWDTEVTESPSRKMKP